MQAWRKSRLFTYLLVGTCAYITEMATLYTLILFDFGPVSAVAISFWVGFIVAFTLQKFITFKSYNRSPKIIAQQMFKYGLLVAWNYGFTLISVRLLSSRLSVFIVRSAVIVIITMWNYVLYQYVFADS